MKFSDLGIEESILKIIEDKGFEKPTDIQIETIPLILEGKDLIGGSATGSGKTLAFGAGMIGKSERHHGIQGLVLVPTRELAVQVAKEIKTFSRYKKLKVMSVYGGVAINPQIEKLKKAEIVVGTPGRILDHISRRTIDFSELRMMVLDEADVMLDMGFITDVENIMRSCKQDRQNLMFTATVTPELESLSRKYMRNPQKISTGVYVDPKKLKQVFYDVPDKKKFSLLVNLLKRDHSGLVMVFCNTQRNTDFVAKNLNLNGLKAIAIHGGLSQARRSRTMDDFHKKDIKILACTDVAARGLDIKGVSHVYNYDLPKESKQYVHRIGRTARAGSDGEAINILASRDHDNYQRILRDNDVKIKKMELPEIERVKIGFKGDSRGSERGGFGGRGRSGGYGRSGGSGRGGYGGSNSGGYGGSSRGGSRSGRSNASGSRSGYGGESSNGQSSNGQSGSGHGGSSSRRRRASWNVR